MVLCLSHMYLRQAFTGLVGLLQVTPEGEWPAESQQERLQASLDACGIKMWELFRVDNDCNVCQGAPLGLMGDAGKQSITQVSEAAKPR